MSDSSEDQNDKPYEATRRKLEEARKKGEIVRSQDVVNFVGLALLMSAILALFNGTVTDLVLQLSEFVRQSVSERRPLDGAVVFGFAKTALMPILLILFVAPMVAMIVGLIAAKQVLFTGDKIKPKLNRVSLLANAKKKFGWSGLFEFTKNFVKFLVFAIWMAVFIQDGHELFEMAIMRGEHLALANTFEVATRWLWLTLGTYAVLAVIDALWQTREHARKNRMSHQEMKDEHKNEEGDANIRQQRRAKAEEIATNRMLLDVPKAVVVITNPTHYAIALQWGGEANTVPKCVARGTDETARKIREIAIQSGVPLYRDPPTARQLYSEVKVGMIIESTHYKAVAAAIGYARRVQEKVRKGRG
ncbi:flagellar type III secretion system protein FlhB [Marivita sp. XM-24bin2]|uniref:EscU/YscU/HrcU family type III secretion system export apparatus switch protein n=1 Tax=unclassified Marivita TaxID=2632480 RepID=UPI000D7B0CE4|nr:flagellar type III secretion system protein FlhB [Marivita sp. XM-24bin2]MCR9109164.1 EscU/YscU/HrcU family type III secretion system export apparatus switch protein [Paracoccaceae bacterium]PWL34732.1 MAG: flagellar biosynthesis protein FlhB [Marivita sp. XM-24bin2]